MNSTSVEMSVDKVRQQAMLFLDGLCEIAEFMHIEPDVDRFSNDQYYAVLESYFQTALSDSTFHSEVMKAVLYSMKPFMQALVAQLRSSSEDVEQDIDPAANDLGSHQVDQNDESVSVDRENLPPECDQSCTRVQTGVASGEVNERQNSSESSNHSVIAARSNFVKHGSFMNKFMSSSPFYLPAHGSDAESAIYKLRDTKEETLSLQLEENTNISQHEYSDLTKKFQAIALQDTECQEKPVDCSLKHSVETASSSSNFKSSKMLSLKAPVVEKNNSMRHSLRVGKDRCFSCNGSQMLHMCSTNSVTINVPEKELMHDSYAVTDLDGLGQPVDYSQKYHAYGNDDYSQSEAFSNIAFPKSLNVSKVSSKLHCSDDDAVIDFGMEDTPFNSLCSSSLMDLYDGISGLQTSDSLLDESLEKNPENALSQKNKILTAENHLLSTVEKDTKLNKNKEAISPNNHLGVSSEEKAKRNVECLTASCSANVLNISDDVSYPKLSTLVEVPCKTMKGLLKRVFKKTLKLLHFKKSDIFYSSENLMLKNQTERKHSSEHDSSTTNKCFARRNSDRIVTKRINKSPISHTEYLALETNGCKSSQSRGMKSVELLPKQKSMAEKRIFLGMQKTHHKSTCKRRLRTSNNIDKMSIRSVYPLPGPRSEQPLRLMNNQKVLSQNYVSSPVLKQNSPVNSIYSGHWSTNVSNLKEKAMTEESTAFGLFRRRLSKTAFSPSPKTASSKKVTSPPVRQYVPLTPSHDMSSHHVPSDEKYSYSNCASSVSYTQKTDGQFFDFETNSKYSLQILEDSEELEHLTLAERALLEECIYLGIPKHKPNEQEAMPLKICLKRRKPQSLQDLCLQVVVNNFDKVISRPGSKAGIRVLQTNSQLLLKKLRETSVPQAAYHSIALFCINQYLKVLNLLWFHPEAVLHAVHKLGTTKSTLAVLSVPSDFSSNILWQVVRLLPKTLQCLCLRNTVCTDTMLESVMQRCPNLRELDLTSCYKITNAGVQALCRKDGKGNIYPNLFLEKLYLHGTKVGYEGTTFALRNFKNLCEIDSLCLNSVLCQMCSNVLRENLSNVHVLNLKSIHFIAYALQPPMYDYALKASSIFCPFLTKLDVPIYTLEELTACMQFRLLEEVHFFIYGFFDFCIFLEARGKTLKRLTVCFCQREFLVPAESLIKFCPRLEYLHLVYASFAKIRKKPVLDAQYTMPHLKVLHVRSWSSNYLEESLMLLLSCSPNLEEFAFANWSDFSSVSFSNSLTQNLPMLTLKTLKMWNVCIDERKLLCALPNFEDVAKKERFFA